MGERTCLIHHCTDKSRSRGMCGRHYERWRRGVDPTAATAYDKTTEIRFFEKVDLAGDCWLWTGGLTSRGYGQFWHEGTNDVAHRWLWCHLVGPVADGLQLDHLCRNRRCVNPDHLEPVTCQENVLRGVGSSASNARKTHCKWGHPLAGANLAMNPNGSRTCRRCHSVRQQAYTRRRCSLIGEG